MSLRAYLQNSRRIHKSRANKSTCWLTQVLSVRSRPWRNSRRLFLKNSGVIFVALLKTRNKLRGSYLSYFVPDVAHTSPRISGRVVMTRETKITENVWIALRSPLFWALVRTDQNGYGNRAKAEKIRHRRGCVGVFPLST
jgi:hypothetical protein